MYQTQHQHHQQQLYLQNSRVHLGQQQQTMIGGMTAHSRLAESHQMHEIEHPGMNDVMCGRGGGTNNHIGNVRFRQLVNGHKLRYLAATKSEKPMVSREVVTIWRGLNPPGRFLKQNPSEDGKSGKWFDVGDKKAREKASQCLRERTPDVASFMKKLELQMTLQEEEEEAKKSGVKLKSEDGETKMTAAALSKELLQMQQAATVKAHMALKAYIPPSISTPFDQEHKQAAMPALNNNMGIFNGPSPIYSLNVPNVNVQSMAQNNTMLNNQREQLAMEIAQLQQKQAQLELEALQRQQQQQQLHRSQQLPPRSRSAAQVHPNPQGNELPPAAVLVGMNPLESHRSHFHSMNNGDPPMSKDDYKQSVRALMGNTKSKSSRSGKSDKSSSKSRHSNRSIGTIDNLKSDSSENVIKKLNEKQSNNVSHHPYADMLEPSKGSYDRDSEFETRSRDSWMKSFNMNNMEEMSLSSGTILSPGSSVKILQGEDYEPEPIHPNEFNHAEGNVNTNTLRKTDTKSLSSFECVILDSMISPANMSQNPAGAQESNLQLPNIYEDQNNNIPQRPRQKSRVASQRSNVSMYSSANSSRPGFSEYKAPSNMSLFSDITDNSFAKREAMRSTKFVKTKSDTSMGTSDNLSDLSEVMGSLEMK